MATTELPAVHTALLVMDVQIGIVARFASDPGRLEPLRAAVDAARAAEIPVIFVRVAFRPGFPEVSPANRSFAAIAQGTSWAADPEMAAIHPAVDPRPDDLVVTKLRVSAFTGSDLEVLLRSRGLTHLVLAGIATSGVVLSTVREAADRDYRITVLSDGCLDMDPEVHRVLTDKIFPRQADVQTVASWRTELAAASHA
ncbi:MAG: cysteine hydrolase [Thermaerobacter sp.]|nr:cysteine hydrolase [Thermaerobacter sp.]